MAWRYNIIRQSKFQKTAGSTRMQKSRQGRRSEAAERVTAVSNSTFIVKTNHKYTTLINHRHFLTLGHKSASVPNFDPLQSHTGTSRSSA